MFTTGIKEAIINDITAIEYRATGDLLLVDGIGKFDVTNVRNLAIYNALATTASTYTNLIAAATGGINIYNGDEVSLSLGIGSTRESKGDFANGRKVGEKPLVIQFIATATAAAAAAPAQLGASIVTAINALSVAEKAVYYLGTASGTTTVTIPFTEWDLTLESVTMHGPGGINAGVTSTIVNSVAGVEGHGLPKYLEESIKASTFENLDPFGIRNDMQVNWNTKYVQVVFDYITEDLEGSTISVNQAPIGISTKYTLWIDEDIIGDGTPGLALIGPLNGAGGAITLANYFYGDYVALAAMSSTTTENTFAVDTTGLVALWIA